VHVDGRVDPASDMETINTELILADLQTLEKAIPRIEKEARMQKDRRPALEAANKAKEILDSGRTLFSAQSEVDNALLHANLARRLRVSLRPRRDQIVERHDLGLDEALLGARTTSCPTATWWSSASTSSSGCSPPAW